MSLKHSDDDTSVISLSGVRAGLGSRRNDRYEPSKYELYVVIILGAAVCAFW